MQAHVRRLERAVAELPHEIGETQRRLLHVREDRSILVEVVVTGRIWLVPPDPRIDRRERAGLHHAEIGQPVHQRSAEILRTRGVAVREHGEGAAGKMFRIRPSCKLDLFRE